MVQTTRHEGIIVDIHSRSMYPGVLECANGRIVSVTKLERAESTRYIMPGFVDAHVHIESSMLVPRMFARMAVLHGTVATVSDPHEIANVCGIDGVRYMVDDGASTPFKFTFGAPSCVPATAFETAGAEITPDDVRELFQDDRIRYLSEMMNWPGVLHNDPVVLEKIRIAHEAGRVVDGHAPGLRGHEARAYAQRGISTDHECFTLEEALDKIEVGMKILIREGSAARNFEALHSLLSTHPDSVMLCSDDMHPDALIVGHINLLVKRAVELGHDIFNVLRAASLHPVEHYGLPVGMLREGDSADFIVVEDLVTFNVLETWIDGVCVAKHGTAQWPILSAGVINSFSAQPINESVLATEHAGRNVRVIVAHDGQLVTTEEIVTLPSSDVCKLVVVNRYSSAPPAVAYIKGIGLARGAFASSVAHDSHNIVAAGCSDSEITAAVNAVIAMQGGISVVTGDDVQTLALPVGGLMSTLDPVMVAEQYSQLDRSVKLLGSELRAPFMTLSFMALLVIPSLKLSDKGLFDGTAFTFCEVVV